ncbi:hypothetical protein P7B02_09760 [Caulobacter segnis]|uniref:hypothetical protein n=1 Tax=Caulobacter segnis TaxID=88688 RepID=UPI00240F11F4|nr:hypothetical protein [Caulobacter segnis]MDG2521827.1 hypothetical protein [Caulobacter segnis]
MPTLPYRVITFFVDHVAHEIHIGQRSADLTWVFSIMRGDEVCEHHEIPATTLSALLGRDGGADAFVVKAQELIQAFSKRRGSRDA